MASVIDRLQVIHEKGYLYLGTCPQAIGFNNSNLGDINLTSFIFSRSYLDENGIHQPAKKTRQFIGNLDYVSLNTHRGVSSSRRDDIESAFYLLWFMIYRKFPWSREA